MKNENYRKLVRNLVNKNNEKIHFKRNIADVISRKESEKN